MFTISRLIFTVLLSIAGVSGSIVTAEGAPWLSQLEARVSIGKSEFLLGEPLFIKVKVANFYEETVRVRDMKGRYFEFSAQDSSGKPVKQLKDPYQSVLVLPVQVLPGADFNDVVFLNRLLYFPGPGNYTVTYHGYVHVQKGSILVGDLNGQAISLSGVVNLKVRKGSVKELDKALMQYLKHLKSGDRKLQSRAARALTVSEPVLTVKLLQEALGGKRGQYPSFTPYAIWALAKIGTDGAVEVLLDVVVDHFQHRMVRTDAIHELGRWRMKKALPTLTKLLSDQNPIIRIAALRSLGDIGDKICIPEVELRFKDPDEKVRATAKKVHKKLTEDEK